MQSGKETIPYKIKEVNIPRRLNHVEDDKKVQKSCRKR